MPVGNSMSPRNSCTSLRLPALDSRHSVKIAKKIKVKEIRMRDKSQKACQFVSLLIRFACVAILFLVTSAIPMKNQAQTQQQRKPTDSVPIPEPASQSHGQTRSPSFQYVATAGGELRGMSTPYTAHPGSRQFVYFSNDKLTIAAAIEVEDIRGGVALLRARTKSYPGTVDRETSERELKSALPREYTYVPMEKLSLAVDGGGVLSLEGAIADESGNLSKPIAPLPVGPEARQTRANVSCPFARL